MSDINEKIHEAVRETYGAVAESSFRESCCAPQIAGTEANCGSASLYEKEMLDGLPDDVTNFSLGCGDPVTIASLQPGETVLDLGCGGGIDVFLAAQQVGEGSRVIGVDMTPAMIDKANKNKAQLGLDNVEFRHGQIEDLPVEEASIDVIMSNCVINLSPEKPAVFREAYRVLKPGGRFSISDIVTDGEFSSELRADLDSWSDCVTGAVPAEDYTAMLRDAGFSDVEIVDKVDAGDIVKPVDGMPRIFSARITGTKPA
jgi:SAM-dependent methyltransferase